jgi:hypothetical protein
MEKKPSRIYEDYKENNISKSIAIKHFISIIEHSEKQKQRVESLKFLQKMNVVDSDVFNLLENLLISDDDEKIRKVAIEYIKESFFEKAFNPMKFSFQHEKSIINLIPIVSTIGKINSEKSNSFLENEIKKIDNSIFSRENLIGEELSSSVLADIFIEYLIIRNLEFKYDKTEYKIDNNHVVELNYRFS